MICGMYFPLYYKNIYHKYSEVKCTGHLKYAMLKYED